MHFFAAKQFLLGNFWIYKFSGSTIWYNHSRQHPIPTYPGTTKLLQFLLNKDFQRLTAPPPPKDKHVTWNGTILKRNFIFQPTIFRSPIFVDVCLLICLFRNVESSACRIISLPDWTTGLPSQELLERPSYRLIIHPQRINKQPWSPRRTRELRCCDAATVITPGQLTHGRVDYLKVVRFFCSTDLDHYTETQKKPPRGRLGDSAICRGKRRPESRVAPNIYLRRASLTRHPKALCIVFEICKYVVCCRYEGCNMMQFSISAYHQNSIYVLYT